ncbi:porin [Escherichia coli]
MNGDGVGGSISYSIRRLSVSLVLTAQLTLPTCRAEPLGNGKKAEQWATGLKYDANNIYLAANYGETRNARRSLINLQTPAASPTKRKTFC